MENQFHKNSNRTYFQIGDANWEMWHVGVFDTEEEAREVIRTEYTERSENDGSDDYWRNREQLVIKITEIREVLDNNNPTPKVEEVKEVISDKKLVEKIADFLEEFAKEVPTNEPGWLTELMADDHKCIKYQETEYYLQEDMTFSEEDEEVYDYLIEHFLN